MREVDQEAGVAVEGERKKALEDAMYSLEVWSNFVTPNTCAACDL
jgi:hypothetical protein